MTDQNLEEKANLSNTTQDNTIPKYVKKIKDDPVIKRFENSAKIFPQKKYQKKNYDKHCIQNKHKESFGDVYYSEHIFILEELFIRRNQKE